MRKLLLGGVIVLLLVLDWAALHDIVKGEPDPYLEYAMVAFSVLVFAAMGFAWLKQRRRA